jgi:protein SCO1/2
LGPIDENCAVLTRRKLLRFERALCAVLITLTAGCASRYQARGLVLKVDPAASELTVSHDAIAGYMDAMVMSFVAHSRETLEEVRPGDRIAFRINVHKGRTMIDRLRLLSAVPADTGASLSPATPTLVRIGQAVPDFTLTNQRGEPVSLRALRGMVLAITFIYTRCPLPDYCPRMMANLDRLRDRFDDRLGQDLALLTISFDPKYDTRSTLHDYAERYKANVPGWQVR